MSADNGIYIGHFADGKIRVIHAQAFENVYYPDGENAAEIVRYFKNAPVFDSLDAAQKEAFKIEQRILNDEYCPILEYGINSVKFSKSFEEYEKILDLELTQPEEPWDY